MDVYGDYISGSDVGANGYIKMWRVAERSSDKNSDERAFEIHCFHFLADMLPIFAARYGALWILGLL